MAFGGLNIGDLLLSVLADGSRLRSDIEKQGIAAANKAGPVIGETLGGSMAAGFASAGKAMDKLGQSMTRNVTLPVTLAGAAITMTGVKFDTTLRQISALTDIAAEDIGGIREALLKLGPEVGKGPQELAESLYFIASAGFDAKESMEILEVAAKGAASGLGDTQDVAKVMSASISAFGRENLNAKDAMDQLIRAIKDGSAEAPDFAGALGDVVGTAALLKVSFADTAGAIAGMTLAGISADEAATSLNQVFRSLLKVTPQAEEAFRSVGLSSESLRIQLREKGLLSVLQTLETAFAGNEVAAAKAFDEVRALRGVMALIGENSERTAYILDDVANGTTNLGTAFDETEGPGRKLGRTMAQVEVTLIALAEDVMPVALEILEEGTAILKTITGAFKSLPEPIRSGIVQILALTAALGPLLVITGKMTKGLGLLIKPLAAVGGKIGAAIGKRMMASVAAEVTASAASGVIGDALADGVSGGVRSGKLAKATDALGKFLGTKLGTGLSLAFAAVAWFEVIQTYNRIKAELAAQNAQIDAALAKQIASAPTTDLETSKRVLEEQLVELNKVWDAGIFTTETRKALEANLAATTAELERRAAGMGPAIASGIEEGAPAVDDALDDLSGRVRGSSWGEDELSAAAKAAGAIIPASIADGILARQNEPAEALDTLKQLMKNVLKPSEEIGRTIGILTSKALAKGLKHANPEVRAEAERVRAIAEKRLAELILAGGKTGKKGAEALAKGLKSKNPTIRAAAQRVKEIVDSRLKKIPPAAARYGASAGSRFISNFKRSISAGGIVTIRVRTSDDTIGGRAGGGPTKAFTPYWVNERTPRTELFVPSTSGYVMTHSDAISALTSALGSPTGGGDTYNVPVQVQGALPVRTIRDISIEMQRIGSLGLLPSRSLSPMYRRRESRT